VLTHKRPPKVNLDGSGRPVSFKELINIKEFREWQPPRDGTPDRHRKPVGGIPGGGPGDGPDPNPNHVYTCAELGLKWNWHRDTIFEFFKDYPGVIKMDRLKTRRQRKQSAADRRPVETYVTLRIPGTVAARFWRQYANK
jgi:hypothetical protein